MWYVDAKRLVDTCVEHDILQKDPGTGAIAVFCAAGNPPEEFPEGWYWIDPDEVYHDIMKDEEGQQLMIARLAEIGVEFTPSQPQIERSMDALMDLMGN